MHGEGTTMTTLAREDRGSQQLSRIPVVIPVRIAVLPTSTGAVFGPVPGALLEIGLGRGRVRVRWELPPGTRLVISLPVDTPTLHLEAE
jgi:hypothetical protein